MVIKKGGKWRNGGAWRRRHQQQHFFRQSNCHSIRTLRNPGRKIEASFFPRVHFPFLTLTRDFALRLSQESYTDAIDAASSPLLAFLGSVALPFPGLAKTLAPFHAPLKSSKLGRWRPAPRFRGWFLSLSPWEGLVEFLPPSLELRFEVSESPSSWLPESRN